MTETGDRWRRIESLFHAVRERPADERAAFLEGACAGDVSLREEVESLLKHEEHALLPADGEGLTIEASATLGASAGRRLGPYVLGPLLGVGGMGEVYRAHDSKLGRDVAIKILPPEFANHRGRLARFAREARVLAALNHPNVGAIYGFEEDESLSGLVLELLDGDTLATRLASGPLPIADALAIAVQIADGLAAAHAKGIVHRDLKPANIAITATGAKVIDFGLAKTEASESGAASSVTTTREGVVLGTAPYMSPEQARGAVVDARTDVWALGCVLYEMLAGRRAFAGDSIVEVLGAVLNKEPDLRALPAGTPRGVRSLIGRCIAKDPAARPGDITQVRLEIEAARHGGGARKWMMPAAVVFTAIVASAVWFSARFVGTRSTPAVPTLGAADAAALAALTPEQLTSSPGFDGFLAFSPDGQNVAFASDRTGTMEIYVQGLAPGSTPTQLTRSGRQNVEPAWSPDGQYIAYHEMAGDGIGIVPSRGGVARKIVDHGSHPAWSPDGRRLAFQSYAMVDLTSVTASDPRNAIWTAEVGGQSRPTLLTTGHDSEWGYAAPAWTPDGQRVIFLGGRTGPNARQIVTWWSVDQAGGRPRQISANPGLSTDFMIAPNGRAIYYVPVGAHTLWSLPLSESGDAAREPEPTGLAVTGTEVHHLAIARDGSHIAWTAVDRTSNLWAVQLDDTARRPLKDPVPLTSGANARFAGGLAAKDGRLAIIGSRPGTNNSVFLLEGNTPPRLVTTDPAVHGPQMWMPGDREILLIANHEKEPGYYALDPNTGRERLLFLFSASPQPPGTMLADRGGTAAFAPDMSKMAFALVKGGVRNIWIAPLTAAGRPTGAATQRTFEKEGGAWPAWSPDGRWIGYQCAAGTSTHQCMIGAAEGDRLEVVSTDGTVFGGGWFTDNDRLLFAAKKDAVWNVAWVSRTTGQTTMVTHFTDPHSYVRNPRWDAANRRIVFERAETPGRVWMVTLPLSSKK